MLFATPGNEILAQENTITTRRATIITRASPISIGKGLNQGGRAARNMKTKVNCVLQITQETFDGLPMKKRGLLQKLRQFVDCESNVRPCETQILKSAHGASVESVTQI